MTISEQSTASTLGRVADGLGPRHHEFVMHLRCLYDKNKADGLFTGLRQLQERSATTEMVMTVPVISRMLQGTRFPNYNETSHLAVLFTGKPPTKKLEGLWRRAAAERGGTKPDIDKQVHEVDPRATVLPRYTAGRRVRIVGSSWGLRRSLAVITAMASAILVIVAFLIDRPWLTATAAVPLAISLGLTFRDGVPLASALQVFAHIRAFTHRDRDRHIDRD